MNSLFVKSVCTVILLFAMSLPAISQRRMVYGFLRDSVTLFPIAHGTIKNSTTNKAVTSDNSGFFRLEAAPNDFIYASAKSYHFDTLRYSYIFTDTITIFLSFAGNVLPAVVVKGQYSRYQLDSIDRKKEFDASRSNYSKTLSTEHPSGFGLSFNLDKMLSKKYRYRKTDEKTYFLIERSEYINYRFSPNLVNYYTGLKGDKLVTFINLYAPSYEWLRQHPTNEDLLYYINDKLKVYRTLRAK